MFPATRFASPLIVCVPLRYCPDAVSYTHLMQQEENYLAQTISQADVDARYDEGVKRLLANKSILAVIMKECVPELSLIHI